MTSLTKTKSNLLHAVLDTNVFVAASLSRSANSPNKELIARWVSGEFVVITSEILLLETIETLASRGVNEEEIIELATALRKYATMIDPSNTQVPSVIVADPDDDHVISCAVLGKADCIVTNDRHIRDLGDSYQGILILESLPFLWKVRGDIKP